MNKKVLVWVGISTILMMGLASVIYLGMTRFMNGVNDDPDTMVDEKAQTALENTTNSDKEDNDEKKTDQNKNWTERKIIKTLHEMTHQKVQASKKWGAIPMTKENVAKMAGVVKRNKDHLKHDDVYRDMLKTWQKGNFGQADEQHNKLWQLQDGTVGIATGLLSEKEEKRFIQQHFGSVDGQLQW